MSTAKSRVRQRIAAINGIVTEAAGSWQSSARSINNYLYQVGKKYHDKIPLNDIFAKCKEHGYEAVQEDGTPWSGFFVGAEGHATIDLKEIATDKLSRHTLSVSWYRMQSGRYEVTAYVS